MKKIIILLCFILSIITASAENLRFRSTGFSYRERNYYGWSDWSYENTYVNIVMSNNLLIIYSQRTQTYSLYNLRDPYQDIDGDWVLKSNFIDQDGDRGEFNLIYRVNDDMWQMYIRFNNVQWVYDVVQQ